MENLVRYLFSLSFNGLDMTEITHSKETILHSGWLEQGDVAMLDMFDTMFEMFKHALL